MRVDLDDIERNEIEELVVALEKIEPQAHCRILRMTGRLENGTITSDDIRIEPGSSHVGVFLPINDYRAHIDWVITNVQFLLRPPSKSE